MTTQPYFTSTTAPNKRFTSREELAQHYKSDWHRYNLKRREANLLPVTEQEFKARLEAALALRRKNNIKKKNGKGKGEASRSHLKDKSQAPPSKVKNLKEQSRQKNHKKVSEKSEVENIDNDEINEHSEDDDDDEETQEEEEEPVIDPLNSLFDNHRSSSLADNIEYMKKKYGFFLPDQEFLVDPEGLIGYCAEKIHLGHICLYCQKAFQSGKDCQKHMVSKGHCKLRYEEGVDLDEWEVFYDFSQDNLKYVEDHKKEKRTKAILASNFHQQLGSDDDFSDDEEDEWEDISDEDSDEDMEGYRDAIAAHGFGVTELGELILPSGKIIGHRTLAKYYNQKFAPEKTGTRKTAMQAVLKDTYGYGYGDDLAITNASNVPSNATISGRRLQANGGGSGKGILVATKGGGFSTVSMYRYRAAVRKAHRQEASWYRHQGKVRNNGNKFDKKGNRLMTGVSVAHAKR